MPDHPQSRFAGGLWCHEVLAVLDRYVDGDLTDAECAAADAHLAECTTCADFGGLYADLVQRLRQRPQTPLDGDRCRRLEDRLALALEEG